MASQNQQQPKPPEPTKRSKPVPSPEFAAARCQRDLRILKEREDKLTAKYAATMAEIKEDRAKLTAELEAAQAKMRAPTGGSSQ